jgi:hypothetical protein
MTGIEAKLLQLFFKELRINKVLNGEKMRSIIANPNRETLVQEINKAFLQWSELEQRIFSQAHYCGQSPEIIAHSIQLDVEEVRATLKQCERRLHASLRSFRKRSCDKPSLSPEGIARLAACDQDLDIQAFAS